MKTKSIISFLIMAFAMVSFAACSNEETIGGGEGTSTGFAVSLSNLQYAKTGGETEFYVRSTGTPSVTTDASWLSVTEQCHILEFRTVNNPCSLHRLVFLPRQLLGENWVQQPKRCLLPLV